MPGLAGQSLNYRGGKIVTGVSGAARQTVLCPSHLLFAETATAGVFGLLGDASPTELMVRPVRHPADSKTAAEKSAQARPRPTRSPFSRPQDQTDKMAPRPRRHRRRTCTDCTRRIELQVIKVPEAKRALSCCHARGSRPHLPLAQRLPQAGQTLRAIGRDPR